MRLLRRSPKTAGLTDVENNKYRRAIAATARRLCAGGGMNELALFAGAGGGILGGKLLGWRTVCAVEWGEYPASVLCARQNDGLLPPFPIWDDVQTFDGKPWRGLVDVVSGGFPCQDISVAGKGAGITGERSGMWTHMARIIGEVRPRFAFVENSPALLTRGLGVVLGDLAALGYDCRWGVLGAADVGANHQRDRLWIVAYAKRLQNIERPDGDLQRGRKDEAEQTWVGGSGERVADTQCTGLQRRTGGGLPSAGRSSIELAREGQAVPDADRERLQEFNPAGIAAIPGRPGREPAAHGRASWWAVEPDVCRVAHGVAARVDRLKAIGNGQVPLCAATAWRLLGGPIA